MPYDFKAARERREKLVEIYRILNQSKEQDGSWDWWIREEIAEIDQELTEAHASINGKMTTARNSGHPVIQFENTLIPIVAHWGLDNKENCNEGHRYCT